MEENLNQTQSMDQEFPTQPETAPEMPQEVPPTPKSGNKLLMLFGVLIILLSLGMGYFAYQTMQLKSQISSVVVTPIPSPSPSADPAAEWEIYSNVNAGITFKHPANITQESVGIAGPLAGNANLVGSFANKSTVAQGTDKPFDGFSVYEVDLNSLGVSFEEYITQEVEAVKNNPEFPAPNAKASQTTIGEKTFTYIDSEFGVRKYFILSPLGNRIAIISRVNSTTEFLNTFDRILSTFEFTN